MKQVEEEIVVPAIPQDLEHQVQVIRAFAQTHNALVAGQFPYGYFKAVGDCIEFIKKVHASAVAAASEHPQADLVPELKAFKETPKEEQAEG